MAMGWALVWDEQAWMQRERAAVEATLEAALPTAATIPCVLHAAMRHSVFAGGKRIRPLLCRAAAEAVAGAPVPAALIPAAALEMVHTYSLIHDDLPALDNDDLRRGVPTCHKVYGEATAILAGDALLTAAFAHLATAEPDATALALIRALCRAAGTPLGMVGGQMADLQAANEDTTPERLRYIHANKTAALIRAALVMGGVSAGATPAQLDGLATAGEEAGQAFQIVDDILDVEGESAVLGKTAGKDATQRKATYPAVFGLEQSRAEAQRHTQQALAPLQGFGAAAAPLQGLIRHLVARQR